MKANPQIDAYLTDGCGRCELYATPACKVHRWAELLSEIRVVLLDSELTEERKWGAPCYTLDGKNVLMMGAFKDNCVISFMQGALLDDPAGLLEKPGPASHVGRVIRFTDADKFHRNIAHIQELIQQAINNQKAGLQYKNELPPPEWPAELLEAFEQDSNFQQAFYALTPGRQKGYLLHFNAAKQSETRHNRIEKAMSRIMAGKGLHDY